MKNSETYLIETMQNLLDEIYVYSCDGNMLPLEYVSELQEQEFKLREIANELMFLKENEENYNDID